MTPADDIVVARSRGAFATALFVVIYLFYWVSFYIYMDISLPPNSFLGQTSQLVAVLMLGAIIFSALFQSNSSLLLSPKLLILILFIWLMAVSAFSPHGLDAVRRLLLALIACVAASAALLLPKNEATFARLIAIGSIIVLVMSYFGVAMLPHYSIHQGTHPDEPSLAGDWRGIFGHKNLAAPAMAIIVMMGLYLRHKWSRFGGTAIALAAFVFLYFSGGKTALGMLPATLALVWITDRHPKWTGIAVISALLAVNLGALGATFSPQVSALIESLGIDPTFTGRVDIWRLAYDAIAHRPITGYGFTLFWTTGQADMVMPDVETWATTASDTHNSYLSVILDGGFPALILILIWLVVLPLRDINASRAPGPGWELNLLFRRIWMFGILLASMESIFLAINGPVWFSLLMATYGLRLSRISYLTARHSS